MPSGMIRTARALTAALLALMIAACAVPGGIAEGDIIVYAYQRTPSGRVAVYEKDSKLGLISEDGQILCDPLYDIMWPFDDGVNCDGTKGFTTAYQRPTDGSSDYLTYLLNGEGESLGPFRNAEILGYHIGRADGETLVFLHRPDYENVHDWYSDSLWRWSWTEVFDRHFNPIGEFPYPIFPHDSLIIGLDRRTEGELCLHFIDAGLNERGTRVFSSDTRWADGDSYLVVRDGATVVWFDASGGEIGRFGLDEAAREDVWININTQGRYTRISCLGYDQTGDDKPRYTSFYVDEAVERIRLPQGAYDMFPIEGTGDGLFRVFYDSGNRPNSIAVTDAGGNSVLPERYAKVRYINGRLYASRTTEAGTECLSVYSPDGTCLNTFSEEVDVLNNGLIVDGTGFLFRLRDPVHPERGGVTCSEFEELSNRTVAIRGTDGKQRIVDDSLNIYELDWDCALLIKGFGDDIVGFGPDRSTQRYLLNDRGERLVPYSGELDF